jgi:hypothetical protein
MSGKKVAEVVGVLAVVVSLVFVGYELRQNNRLALAAAYQSIGIATAEAWIDMSRDERAINLLFVASLDSLDEVDWAGALVEWTGWVRLLETLQLQIELGILPPDAVERLGFVWATESLSEPMFSCLWPMIKRDVSPSVIALVESKHEPDQFDCTRYRLPARW